MGVLDEDAAVHDNLDTSLLGPRGGFEAHDAKLNPEIFQAEGNHFVDDGGDELGQAEDVDDIGLDGKRGERRVDGFAEQG